MTNFYGGRGAFSGRDLEVLAGTGRLGRDIDASHTVNLYDIHYILRQTGASAINITIPSVASGYAWEAGMALVCNNYGAGLMTLVAGSGVTIQNKDGLVSAGQHAWFGAYYWGADIWSTFGSLTT